MLPTQQICIPGRSEQGRRHRSLIDVIQDLEQENAAEVASSGVSPASDRPVPLDLTGATSDPLPAAADLQHQQQQHQHQQQQSPGLVSHRLQHSEDGSESLSCPPGAKVTVGMVQSAACMRQDRRPELKSMLSEGSLLCPARSCIQYCVKLGFPVVGSHHQFQ